MNTTQRNAVTVTGNISGQPMMFAHGYGCDQNMWRYVTPSFSDTHQIVLFDNVGSGKSDLSAYDEKQYSSLDGYADDVLDIVHEHGLRYVVFVGHSVSAMIGVLAAIRAPERFAKLVLIGPSPCYIDDQGYIIAPTVVGEYVHRHLAGSTLVQMNATGHCPNLSAPEETVAAIRSYL